MPRFGQWYVMECVIIFMYSVYSLCVCVCVCERSRALCCLKHSAHSVCLCVCTCECVAVCMCVCVCVDPEHTQQCPDEKRPQREKCGSAITHNASVVPALRH